MNSLLVCYSSTMAFVCLLATVGSMTQAAMKLGLCNSKNDNIIIASLGCLMLSVM